MIPLIFGRNFRNIILLLRSAACSTSRHAAALVNVRGWVWTREACIIRCFCPAMEIGMLQRRIG